MGYHRRKAVAKRWKMAAAFGAGAVATVFGAFYGARAISRNWINAQEKTQNYNLVDMKVTQNMMKIRAVEPGSTDTLQFDYPVISKTDNYFNAPKSDEATYRARVQGESMNKLLDREFSELQIEQKNTDPFRNTSGTQADKDLPWIVKTIVPDVLLNDFTDSRGDISIFKEDIVEFDGHPPAKVFSINQDLMTKDAYRNVQKIFHVPNEPQQANFLLGKPTKN